MKQIVTKRRTGFTLIEILVVIAIIAVLAGILLAALGGVQSAAKKTQTNSLMQSFARACDEFALDHGRYPGLLPDSAIDGLEITSTQNALLELMGGARVVNPYSTTSASNEFNAFRDNETDYFTTTDSNTGIVWEFSFDANRFGEGPWINGRKYEPYFSPKSSDIVYDPTQYDPVNTETTTLRFPSIVDAWDKPIIYLRAIRKSGPIIDDPSNGSNANYSLPQYELPGMNSFFADSLNSSFSLLANDSEDRVTWLTMLLAHPTFWEQDTTWDESGPYDVAWGTSRGRYLIISAGPDTIFLEIENTPTNPFNDDNPYTLQEIKTPTNTSVNPAMMESFDDVVVHGGA
ncbi:MAG: type II secretion system protein [Phycisphaerales bacterium]|nr:type II secretion system protein [Planctomycetota bacterium]MBL6997908.1 type II secretion system protein [Phycisphaerales bacterium]